MAEEDPKKPTGWTKPPLSPDTGEGGANWKEISKDTDQLSFATQKEDEKTIKAMQEIDTVKEKIKGVEADLEALKSQTGEDAEAQRTVNTMLLSVLGGSLWKAEAKLEGLKSIPAPVKEAEPAIEIKKDTEEWDSGKISYISRETKFQIRNTPPANILNLKNNEGNLVFKNPDAWEKVRTVLDAPTDRLVRMVDFWENWAKDPSHKNHRVALECLAAFAQALGIKEEKEAIKPKPKVVAGALKVETEGPLGEEIPQTETKNEPSETVTPEEKNTHEVTQEQVPLNERHSLSLNPESIVKMGNSYFGYYISPSVDIKGKTIKELAGDHVTFRDMKEIGAASIDRVKEMLREEYSKEKRPAAKKKVYEKITLPESDREKFYDELGKDEAFLKFLKESGLRFVSDRRVKPIKITEKGKDLQLEINVEEEHSNNFGLEIKSSLRKEDGEIVFGPIEYEGKVLLQNSLQSKGIEKEIHRILGYLANKIVLGGNEQAPEARETPEEAVKEVGEAINKYTEKESEESDDKAEKISKLREKIEQSERTIDDYKSRVASYKIRIDSGDGTPAGLEIYEQRLKAEERSQNKMLEELSELERSDSQ